MREKVARARLVGRAPAALMTIVPPLLWAGNFVIGRAVHSDISPMALTFWRWVVAAIALLPFALAQTYACRHVIRREWRLVGILCLSGVIGFQVFVYQGLRTTTAINGVLIIATIPLVIPIIAYAIDGARVTARQALGIVVSFIGVAIVMIADNSVTPGSFSFREGDLWIGLAVPMWALYSVMVRRRPADLPPLALLLASILPGVGLLSLGWAWEFAHIGGFQLTGSALLAIGYVGVFASVLAFLCWNQGVAKIGANKAGLFIHLMPVFAVILAVIFLGESLETRHVAGIVAIATGLYLSSTARTVVPVRSS